MKQRGFNCTEYHNEHNLLHREDGPAIEWDDGGKSWYINGEKHRTDGPAHEYANGSKFWYVNDRLHRLDGPAIENKLGLKLYYINGIEINHLKKIFKVYIEHRKYLDQRISTTLLCSS